MGLLDYADAMMRSCSAREQGLGAERPNHPQCPNGKMVKWRNGEMPKRRIARRKTVASETPKESNCRLASQAPLRASEQIAKINTLSWPSARRRRSEREKEREEEREGVMDEHRIASHRIASSIERPLAMALRSPRPALGAISQRH